MPNVPTAKERGFEAEFYIWSGVFAIKGTPEPAVKILREAIREAVKKPQFVNGHGEGGNAHPVYGPARIQEVPGGG